MATTKKTYSCNICNIPFKNYTAFYYHINKLHNNMTSYKNSSIPTPTLKRQYSVEVNGLVDRGIEALLSGGDKKRIITRWTSSNEMALDVDKLLDKTEEKANGLKNKYVDAKSKLENKYKKLLMNEASTAYLVYLANLPADHDKYDQMLNDELKFVDYLSDLIKFGIP